MNKSKAEGRDLPAVAVKEMIELCKNDKRNEKSILSCLFVSVNENLIVSQIKDQAVHCVVPVGLH